jgi:hypothetical protein
MRESARWNLPYTDSFNFINLETDVLETPSLSIKFRLNVSNSSLYAIRFIVIGGLNSCLYRIDLMLIRLFPGSFNFEIFKFQI